MAYTNTFYILSCNTQNVASALIQFNGKVDSHFLCTLRKLNSTGIHTFIEALVGMVDCIWKGDIVEGGVSCGTQIYRNECAYLC